jgi:hypothetical protein
MRIVVTTSDEEITLFESEREFEKAEKLENISINSFGDVLAISNTPCECLLDRIIKNSEGKWANTREKQMQKVESFNYADVEKIEILLR